MAQWQELERFAMGDGDSALADKLAALVAAGLKTATCCRVSSGIDTHVGKQMVLCDGSGRPIAVIETTELTERRFNEVDARFAYEEGEGDRSLEYWRDAHRRHFTRHGVFAEDMLLHCERFRVVEALEDSDPLHGVVETRLSRDQRLTSDVTLRAATPADIPRLHQLMRDFAAYEGVEHRFYLTEAGLHEALFGPLPLIEAVLAETDDTAVGFALWMVFFGTISGEYGLFVTNLFVAEPYRCRGIGSSLFRHIARTAVEKRYSVVQWDVNRTNTGAIEFYRRIGAQPVTNDLMMEELRGDALLALASD